MYTENMIQYFSNDAIHNIIVKIENPEISTNDIIKEFINIIFNAGIKRKKSLRPRNQSPWFDKHCREPKQIKLKLLRQFRSSRNLSTA